MKRVIFVCSIGLMSTLATVAACKQGEGERCQVDEDCGARLVCNKAKSTCVSEGNDNEIDASVIDTVPFMDAPADAATDAMIDAP